MSEPDHTPGGPRRIADDPTEPTAAALDAIVVDGERVPLRAGETIAACLLAAGRLGWRTTRFGHRPRGVFCGIGLCFDCLVTVNGVAGIRACRRTARPGDTVTTGAAEPVLSAPAPGGGTATAASGDPEVVEP